MRLVMFRLGFGPSGAFGPWLLAAVTVLTGAAGCGSDGVIGAPAVDIAQVDAGPDGSATDAADDATAGDTLVQDDGVLPPDTGTETADSEGDASLPDGQTVTTDIVQEDVASPDAADVAAPDGDDTGAADANQDDAGLPDVATVVDATEDAASPQDTATADAPADAIAVDVVGDVDNDTSLSATDVGAGDAPNDVAPCDPLACQAPDSVCLQAACVQGQCGAVPLADGVTCSDGNACSTADACLAGVCTGAKVVCDDGNPCTNDSCSLLTGSCETALNAAPCEDGNACTTSDACAAGSCTPGSVAVCEDGSPCTTDSCDPTKGCTTTAVPGTCSDGDDCTLTDTCVNGACLGTAQVCNDGNVCTADKCVSGKGCLFTAITGALCSDNNACTQNDACGGGKCSGTAVNCSDDNPCTTDTCDANAGCGYKSNTASCDDGLICTDSDACNGGVCTGTPKTCTDGNPCTDDQCDPADGCLFVGNTAPCTVTGTCEQGACSLGQCVGSGNVSCDDANPCTTDSCAGSAGCKHTPVSGGTVCGDGDACIGQSTCQAGTCKSGAPTDCSDGKGCTNDSCDKVNGCSWSPSTGPCDDGDACTSGDVCGVVPGQGSQCKSGTPMGAGECSDNDTCTTDSCNSKIGCVHTPTSQATTCDDGNACTLGENCQTGQCAGGTAANCNDTNPCTTDSCNPQTGFCQWQATTGSCDDGDPCTTAEKCTAGKCTGVATVCDDKNPCTVDTCDKAKQDCVFVPATDGGSCSDGNACTSSDACKAGVCTGTAKACGDGNSCTTDTCDTVSGLCANNNTSGPCVPSTPCQSGGSCQSGQCVSLGVLNCDDNNPCTTDSCDPTTGKCAYLPATDKTPCTDWASCTTATTCQSGECKPDAPCSVFSSSFECGQPSGFTFSAPPSDVAGVSRLVNWAVDNTPAVPDVAKWGCTLNLNDGVDHCDEIPGQPGQCLLPLAKATSPLLDFTKSQGLTPRVRFAVYFDVDVQVTPGAGWDSPQLEVLDSAGAVQALVVLPVTAANVQKWNEQYELLLPEAAGKQVYLRFGMHLPLVSQFDPNNVGVGIFVDNLTVDAVWLQETCSDGIDNDGDGTVDCKDSSCAADPWCNPLFAESFSCTSSGIWQFASTDNVVTWAVDNTPGAPAFDNGDCALNFNNGVNYNALNATQANEAVSGIALLSAMVDTTAASGPLSLQYRYWLDLETSVDYDNTYIQISTDDFSGCCGLVCTFSTAACSSANTKSFQIPRTGAAMTWLTAKHDISAFAGKQFKVRVRFDSIDSLDNTGAGAFVDDLRVIAQ